MSNIKLKNHTKSDKFYGRLEPNDIRDIYLFVGEMTGKARLRIILKNGSEITVGAEGSQEIIEWDSDTATATTRQLDAGLMDELVENIDLSL